MSDKEFYSMTLLNSTGDITLTWEDEQEEAMKAMIQKKIDQGYAFFILEPRSGFLKLLGRKKVTIKDVSQIKSNHVTMDTDDETAKILFKEVDFQLGDELADKLFKSGKVGIANVPQSDYSTVRKTKDVKEIMKSHTVATPRIVAG